MMRTARNTRCLSLFYGGNRMSESYKTIAQAASAEFTEKKSRFIGHIFPIEREEQAMELIARLKKEYWDARHNTYAYVLRGGMLRRFSDDGEPQGTAGMPMLDVLVKNELEDCLVVVTRYFGGILLGTGGLVRAYSHATALAIEAAGIVQMLPCRLGCVRCPYPMYQELTALIEECGGKVAAQDFADAVTVSYEMPLTDESAFDEKLTDMSAGTLSAEKGDVVTRPFPVG